MSNAIDCDFSVQGSGPALFLTHGIGAAKNAWRFMISELSKYFTVVTYDLRGCLLYTSPSPRDQLTSRMPSSA